MMNQRHNNIIGIIRATGTILSLLLGLLLVKPKYPCLMMN
jgi:hypothetical protein